MRKIITLFLFAVLVLSIAACGKQRDGAAAKDTDSTDDPGLVYAPEFLDLDDGKNINLTNACFVGDDLYYMTYNWDMESKVLLSMTLNRYSIPEGATAETTLLLPENANMSAWTIGGDGSLYAILAYWNWNEATGSSHNTYMLAKYDTRGEELFVSDFTSILKNDSYLGGIAVDGHGRAYIVDHSFDSVIWLFDADGNSAGRVDFNSGMEGQVKSFCRGTDGRVHVVTAKRDSSGAMLYAIDFEKKKLEDICSDFPSAEAFCQNAESSFVLHDGVAVYVYDMDSREKEKLFDWLDCDVTGQYVSGVGALSDGRIAAAFQDWQSYDSGLVLINRVRADQVVPKQEIVLGMMYNSIDIDAAVARFNKRNSSYHVTVRYYIDDDQVTGTAALDALTRLNLDITSDNCPDIISLNGINVQQMAAKGVFEDLAPYLEKSSVDRGDLLENILEAYTFDNKLVCIPDSFLIRTTVGSRALVGEEMGWNLEEMIALWDAHPDAELFDGMSKEEILEYCLAYNMDTFVDWDTGSCHFDTDEFKGLLEFVDRFPDTDSNNVAGGEDRLTTPERIVKGEVLLCNVLIGKLDIIQLYEGMFGGPVICIGYPASDGKSGSILSSYGTYAIASRSQVKEGAWIFLESYLTRENISDRPGFPNSKSELERMAAEAVHVEYVLDENGDPLLDEQGNPVIKSQGSHGTSYGDWTYEYRVPTREEVDMVLELIKASGLGDRSSEPIMTIIGEDAEAFFQGQKSVDEVAETVQRRASVYVSENS